MSLVAAHAFAEAGAAVLMADLREDVVHGEAQKLGHILNPRARTWPQNI